MKGFKNRDVFLLTGPVRRREQRPCLNALREDMAFPSHVVGPVAFDVQALGSAWVSTVFMRLLFVVRVGDDAQGELSRRNLAVFPFECVND